ncbi:MAG: hypothetical protein RIQ89_1729 [Bacteroidota bacterium]
MNYVILRIQIILKNELFCYTIFLYLFLTFQNQLKMKSKVIIAAVCLAFAGTRSFAQVGIGTTSPVSTLDVRGSASFNTRNLTATATLTSTDHTIIYSGTSTATLTLPSASACAGREIWIKNSSSYAVSIATTSSQTIDGNSTWSIPSQYETVLFMSNGANWIVSNKLLRAMAVLIRNKEVILKL